jgi:hypothetical protein
MDINFFDDVFEPRFCTFLLTDARARLGDSREFSRSNFHWDPAIRRASAPVLVRDYDPALAALIIAGLRKRGVIEHDRYSVMNYAWTRLSYIPWHDDGHRDQAITIYLNDVWELDWGGLFLYKDEAGDIRAMPPRFNAGLKNNRNVAHSTTPVSLDAPGPSFTIQLFLKNRD